MTATGVSWPLTAYYFGHLPIAFLPTNLLILPLLPVYISVAISTLCLSATGVNIQVLPYLTDRGYELLMQFVATMARTGGTLEIQAGEETLALWMISVAALALTLHLRCRRTHRIVLGGIGIISSVLSIIMIPAQESMAFIVKNDTPSLTQILVRNQGKSETVTFRPGALSIKEIRGISFAMLDCNLPEDPPSETLKCRYLIISRGFGSDLSRLSGHIYADTIIIHQSVRRSRESYLMHEADSLGLPALSLREAPLRR